MSLELIRTLHILFVFLIVMSLAGATLHMMDGGSRVFAMRKFLAISHGLGMLGAFMFGGMMIGKLYPGQAPPLWIWLKIAIWLVLGAMPAFIYRKPGLAKLWWWGTLLLVGIAAALVNIKPT